MAEDIKAAIDDIVKSHKIVLFMKGSPSFPMCGFSQQTSAILATYEKPFKHVDVIEEPQFREAIKQYSNWPTIPQIYVNGEFLGGCDIARDMYESGDLEKLISAAFASE